MKYYLIAGEASGDLHGSNLMKGLKSVDPNCEFRFWGGDLMKAEGGTLVKHFKDGAVMGFVEVVKKLDVIFSNLKNAKKDILDYKPDVVILIDYPGFNFKIAKFAKNHNIKVFYYIAPKVWAWKESRVKRLQKYVDRLFIIFPFEVEYFKKWDIDAIYCGNPLLDKIESSGCMMEERRNFFSRHSLKDNLPIVALLAGSRKLEINFLLPKMVALANRYSDKYQFLLGAAPAIEISSYKKIIGDANIKIIQNDTYSLLRHSRSAIISSGTASLEAALIGVPQVVCYGGNPLSIFIAKRLVKLKYISLANLIINKLAFKELIQNECNINTLSNELDTLNNDEEYRKKMFESYREIRASLGDIGASERVAKEMIKFLN